MRQGGRNRQLPPGDTLPMAWDELKTVAAVSGVATLDLSSPAGFRVSLTGDTTLAFSNVPAGRVVVFTVVFVQDATGGRVVTFPASVKADGGGSPTAPSTASGSVTVQSFYTDDGGVTIWQARGMSAKLNAISDAAWAANKLLYLTGPDSAEVTDLAVQARTFLAALTKSDQRTALGLGTAAVRAAQTSATDTTAGALIAVGAFGLGDPIRLFNALGITDLNEVDIPGDYWLDGGVNWVNCPVDAGQLIVHGAGKTYLTQEIYDYASSFHGERRKIDTVWTEWERVYTANTILGTVSQLAGVPTGAIIESGSNANGGYVRFADGTQICVSPDIAASATADATWTFPSEFSIAPLCLGTPRTNNANIVGYCRPNGTTTSVNFCAYVGNTSARSSAEFTIYAIGRWF